MDRTAALEYAQRMNRVIDHIDRHLSEDIDLTHLAGVANFSPFHFHRLFSAWMGETLGSYLRRRRLEVAALLLAHEPRRTVLEIAVEVGFGSAEAFARAFKLHFGMTPSTSRRLAQRRWTDRRGADSGSAPEKVQSRALSKMDQAADPGLLDHGRSKLPETLMKIEIFTLPPVRVAYMRHIGSYGPEITRFWQEDFLPWRSTRGLESAPCYGVAHDDPDITPHGKCRYDACVAVPDDFSMSAPASICHLPGGRYAIATFRGRPQEAVAAWASFLSDWLPSSGMQPDHRPFLECYPASAFRQEASGILECELCMPVKPL